MGDVENGEAYVNKSRETGMKDGELRTQKHPPASCCISIITAIISPGINQAHMYLCPGGLVFISIATTCVLISLCVDKYPLIHHHLSFAIA